MIIEKTIKTLIAKPLIILMAAVMFALPSVAAVLHGGADYVNNQPEKYNMLYALYSYLFMILLVGIFSEYTYRVCAGKSMKGLLRKGFFKNTFRIIAVILAARLVGMLVSGAGITYSLFFGEHITWLILLSGIILQTFEAVVQVSIAATDNFTDAFDHAVSVTKGIYIYVVVISIIFGIAEYLLFSEAGFYRMTQAEFLKYNILYGLFNMFTTAFVLVYCAHHFVEDKMINDAAMDRLNVGLKKRE